MVVDAGYVTYAAPRDDEDLEERPVTTRFSLKSTLPGEFYETPGPGDFESDVTEGGIYKEATTEPNMGDVVQVSRVGQFKDAYRYKVVKNGVTEYFYIKKPGQLTTEQLDKMTPEDFDKINSARKLFTYVEEMVKAFGARDNFLKGRRAEDNPQDTAKIAALAAKSKAADRNTVIKREDIANKPGESWDDEPITMADIETSVIVDPDRPKDGTNGWAYRSLIVTLKDGTQVFVAESANKELYDQLSGYYSYDKSGPPDEPEDFTEGGKYKKGDKLPALKDIKRIGKVFPEVIQYETVDGKFLYADSNDKTEFKHPYDDRPATSKTTLHEYIEDLRDIITARDNFKKKPNAVIADDKTPIPDRADIEGKVEVVLVDPDKPQGAYAPFVYVYKNKKDGKEYFVTEGYADKHFDKLQEYMGIQGDREVEESQNHNTINNYRANHKDLTNSGVLGPQDVIHTKHITNVTRKNGDKELPDGMFIVSVKDHPRIKAGDYLVAEIRSPASYSAASDFFFDPKTKNNKDLKGNEDIDAFNEAMSKDPDLGEVTSADWDLQKIPTTIDRNKDKPEKGKMTVGELAIDKMIQDYQEKAKKDPNGPEAQFLSAIKAISFARNGGEFLIMREDPDGEDLQGVADIAPEDIAALIKDPQKILDAQDEVWNLKKIQEDYANYVEDAFESVDGAEKEKRAERLAKIIGSTAFSEYLFEIEKSGRGTTSAFISGTAINTLRNIAPKDKEGKQPLLLDAMEKMKNNGMILNILRGMDEIDPDTMDAATRDIVTNLIGVLRMGPFAGVMVPGTIDYLKGLLNDKAGLQQFSKVLTELFKYMKTPGADIRNITTTVLDDAFKKAGVQPRGAIYSTFSALNKVGILASITGATGFAQGVYRAIHLDDDGELTAEERLAIARGIIALPNWGEFGFMRLYAGVYDLMKKPESASAFSFLGFDDNVPGLFSKANNYEGYLKKFVDASNEKWAEFAKEQGFSVEDFDNVEEYKKWHEQHTAGMTSDQKANYERLVAQYESKYKTKPLNSRAGLYALGITKGLTTGLDPATGFMSLALAIVDMKGFTSADTMGKVWRGFGIAGASLEALAGVMSGVGTFFRSIPAISGAVAPVYILAAVMYAVTFGVLLAISKDKENYKAQLDELKHLEKTGGLHDDWGDRFEYIQRHYDTFNGRNYIKGDGKFEDVFGKDEDRFMYGKDAKLAPIEDGLSIFDVDMFGVEDWGEKNYQRFKNEWKPGENSEQDFLTDNDQITLRTTKLTGHYITGRSVHEWHDYGGFTTNEDDEPDVRQDDVVDAYFKAWQHWFGGISKSYKGVDMPSNGSEAKRFDALGEGWALKNFEEFEDAYVAGKNQDAYNDIFLDEREKERIFFMRAWEALWGAHKDYKGDDLPEGADIFTYDLLGGPGWGQKNWERFMKAFDPKGTDAENLAEAKRVLLSWEDWRSIAKYTSDYVDEIVGDPVPGLGQ